MHIETVTDKSQIKSIESLAYEIWHEHYTPIIGKAQVNYMLEKFQSVKAVKDQIADGFLYFLCEHNNISVGYMSVNMRGEELFLSKIYVASADRRKGYGREMVVFLEEIAREKALNKISLTVNRYNTNSITMYEKVGFSICGRVIQDIGNGFVMDDYKMEKKDLVYDSYQKASIK